MNKTIEYLRKKEWSMGNGQCPECCGVPKSWHGHPCYMKADSIGHKKDCGLALSLKDLGEKPVMRGEYKSTAEYEHFIFEQGIMGTRRKTKEGCPRQKEYDKRFQASMDKFIADSFNK